MKINFIGKLMCYCIKFYQYWISILIPNKRCIYKPTCSQYFIEAIESHGPFKGLFMGVKRILRCNPAEEGGYDPVPK